MLKDSWLLESVLNPVHTEGWKLPPEVDFLFPQVRTRQLNSARMQRGGGKGHLGYGTVGVTGVQDVGGEWALLIQSLA